VKRCGDGNTFGLSADTGKPGGNRRGWAVAQRMFFGSIPVLSLD
jgi:hypothetical protein